ncbi:Aste57867_8963 [Aphanomyces stellatus]|uniref:Aste57867_8963 protein n=1 Tax=Aphanomyces stellatus TaxID=120398 RepID=A0A485KLT5_9STRA|nr:hypothetical protein As57867_008928 [Aphanomyces stellatus]VFT85847.1 Aste57867_8963 [Aphanomyces stellatus]
MAQNVFAARDLVLAITSYQDGLVHDFLPFIALRDFKTSLSTCGSRQAQRDTLAAATRVVEVWLDHSPIDRLHLLLETLPHMEFPALMCGLYGGRIDLLACLFAQKPSLRGLSGFDFFALGSGGSLATIQYLEVEDLRVDCALMYAAQAGHEKVVKYLWARHSSNRELMGLALTMAAAENQDAIVRFLFPSCESESVLIALGSMAQLQQLETVLLILRRSSPATKKAWSAAALGACARHGFEDMVTAILHDGHFAHLCSDDVTATASAGYLGILQALHEARLSTEDHESAVNAAAWQQGWSYAMPTLVRTNRLDMMQWFVSTQLPPTRSLQECFEHAMKVALKLKKRDVIEWLVGQFGEFANLE